MRPLDAKQEMLEVSGRAPLSREGPHVAFRSVEKTTIRNWPLREEIRMDLPCRQIRLLSAEWVEVPVHVPAWRVFQILGIITCHAAHGADNLSPVNAKRYMHQYNSPCSLTVSRPRRLPRSCRGSHGDLAERALFPVPASREDFPYAIRGSPETMAPTASSMAPSAPRPCPSSRPACRCAPRRGHRDGPSRPVRSMVSSRPSP